MVYSLKHIQCTDWLETPALSHQSSVPLGKLFKFSETFWIHSFSDGHLGCFQYLANVNCAAMNIGVHRFFWIGVSEFLGYNPSSGIAGSKGSSIFSFLRKFHTVFHSGRTMVHLHNGILCSREKEGVYTIYNGMDGTGEHYAK